MNLLTNNECTKISLDKFPNSGPTTASNFQGLIPQRGLMTNSLDAILIRTNISGKKLNIFILVLDKIL